MQGKAKKHLLRAISALNKRPGLSFGNGQIYKIKISLQYNECNVDLMNKFLGLIQKKALISMEQRFKSFIGSKMQFLSEEVTFAVHQPTKFEDYQLQQESLLNIDFTASSVPTAAIASSIYDFFDANFNFFLLEHYHYIICIRFNGLRYLPSYEIFENEMFPQYIDSFDKNNQRSLSMYIIQGINVSLRPGPSVADVGEFLNIDNLKSHIKLRAVHYDTLGYYNPGLHIHRDLTIEVSRLHVEQHSIVEIDIKILPKLKYRGEYLMLKSIASDMTNIVNGILSTEIQNDGLDVIIRFNSRKFAISDGSERRTKALKQTIDWERQGVPLFLDDAFDNMPHNLREHG